MFKSFSKAVESNKPKGDANVVTLEASISQGRRNRLVTRVGRLLMFSQFISSAERGVNLGQAHMNAFRTKQTRESNPYAMLKPQATPGNVQIRQTALIYR